MSNLTADQKTNWQANETVVPSSMNKIGEGINAVTTLMPVYAATGSFYQNTDYSNSIYTLEPLTFSDDSQNAAPEDYYNGMEVVFKSVASNTGDSYVNVNGLGNKQIKTLKNQTITASTIPEGWITTLRYDSANDCFYILENKGSVGRNVGDFFWTWRTDTSLNGAYECSGTEFNYNDFTGDTNPYDLLVAGSLPYLSYDDYATALETNGVCGYFGLDTTNKKFKLPKINSVQIQAGDASTVSQYTDASYISGSVDSKTITLRPMIQLSTGADESSLANTTQCLATLPQKANIIWYADRDFEYKVPNFIQADKQYVTIKGGTAIRKKNGEYFYTENDMVKAISDILDTGSVSNGKDYYFYIDNTGNLVASLDETNPSTGTTTNTVQIGGAHTLCVSVTSSNVPTLPSDSFFTTHPAIGYDAGYFIPNSSWTPAYHSLAKTGNKGQALVEYGAYKFWCDIYLMSGTGANTTSSYAGTITNSRQYQLMFNDLAVVGKFAPNHQEFIILAEGSNQCTNIAGSAIPSDKKCGGYLDTAGKRMISGFFIECCCGYLWQISRDLGPTGSKDWNAYSVTTRGGTYGIPYVLELGGGYADSSNCGSWSRNSYANLLHASAGGGARGLSLHEERQHI